jgi:branched-chain amino acid transport system permease protein
MLVVGGVSTLSGAVLGALLISGLNSFLADAEQGVTIGFHFTLPTGTRLVTIGAVMALVLILRPSGITGGREFRLPRRWRTAPAAPSKPGPDPGADQLEDCAPGR